MLSYILLSFASVKEINGTENNEAFGTGNIEANNIAIWLLKFKMLKMLNISECSELEELRSFEHLRLLEKLRTWRCVNLKSIPTLVQWTKLRTLDIIVCSQLEELPSVDGLRFDISVWSTMEANTMTESSVVNSPSKILLQETFEDFQKYTKGGIGSNHMSKWAMRAM